MNRDILYFKNRIRLLSNRDRDNSRIIKKLERKIRMLSK